MGIKKKFDFFDNVIFNKYLTFIKPFSFSPNAKALENTRNTKQNTTHKTQCRQVVTARGVERVVQHV